MTIYRRAALAMAIAAASLAAHGGGGIGGTGSPAFGRLRVFLTDAPACGFEAVNVSVQKVRVHTSATATAADPGWSDVTLSAPARVDLLTLTNGALLELGQTQLPAGRYAQLLLVLADNTTSTPLANSVVPSGGSEVPLVMPGNTQSGVKVNTDLQVSKDELADLVLDFDACRSVVPHSSTGQYLLKPVIQTVPAAGMAGQRVIGFVDPAVVTPSATSVSLQLNGVPVKSTVPDPTGRFVLFPVPAGAYDLVVASTGRVTAVMTGVPVSETAPTPVNSANLPIAPPAASMRPVNGSVNPAKATVAAYQTLAGGRRVQAAWAPVDAGSGAFQAALPIQPPVRTAYMANPVSLAFTTDTAAGGRYTVVAESAGTTKSRPIDVSAPVGPMNFRFR
jgi:hypothetical protein